MPTKKKKKTDLLKLNLGAGETPLKGYENLDRMTGQEIYPLAYDDGVADEIRASHVLEHFSHRDTAAVLADWIRVLKPGGVLKIAVPDFEKIIAGVIAHASINVEGYLMGGHVDENDRHGAIFTGQKLCELLSGLGMERIHNWTPTEIDCSSLPISLNVKAFKPSIPHGEAPFNGVTFCLAAPRYGPSEHHRCILETLARFKARVRIVSGCFWNQHLGEAIEAEIAEPDCRYICTLDYDSVFAPDDVAELYRIMETHPEIDALLPMQSGRGSDKPLFTMRDHDGVPMKEVLPGVFEGITCKVATGHFGLTFIRAEKLRQLPRPWMVGVPDSDGRWTSGRIDPDIYFWYEWAKAKNTIHMANHVVIGHIEDVIMWPKDDLTPCYQRVSDYIKGGKPKEAR